MMIARSRGKAVRLDWDSGRHRMVTPGWRSRFNAFDAALWFTFGGLLMGASWISTILWG